MALKLTIKRQNWRHAPNYKNSDSNLLAQWNTAFSEPKCFYVVDAALVTATNDSYLPKRGSRAYLCHWFTHEEEMGWLAKCSNLISNMASKHLVCI